MKSSPRGAGAPGQRGSAGLIAMFRESSRVLHEGWHLMSDLAWPVTCIGCGVWSDQAWCATCVEWCGGPGIQRNVPPHGLPIYAATEFDGPISHAITAYKDEGRRDGAPELIRLLRRACAQALIQAPSDVASWWVVPVPSSSKAIQRRGFAPLEELMRGFVGSGLQRGPRLEVVRNVADQSHLGRQGRRANMSGAFRLINDEPLPPRSGVLLVDDVVTSGATMNAALCAVQELEPHYIVGVAIASTTLKWAKKADRK